MKRKYPRDILRHGRGIVDLNTFLGHSFAPFFATLFATLTFFSPFLLFRLFLWILGTWNYWDCCCGWWIQIITPFAHLPGSTAFNESGTHKGKVTNNVTVYIRCETECSKKGLTDFDWWSNGTTCNRKIKLLFKLFETHIHLHFIRTLLSNSGQYTMCYLYLDYCFQGLRVFHTYMHCKLFLKNITTTRWFGPFCVYCLLFSTTWEPTFIQ